MDCVGPNSVLESTSRSYVRWRVRAFVLPVQKVLYRPGLTASVPIVFRSQHPEATSVGASVLFCTHPLLRRGLAAGGYRKAPHYVRGFVIYL